MLLNIRIFLRGVISVELNSKLNVVLLGFELSHDSQNSLFKLADAPTHRTSGIEYKKDIN